ncbi:MAG: hypothetical protein LBT86_04495 [Deltaproteobacteria bacterium]|nr:hypothetical protein [Deltaproteobacteria bacterium]
MVWVWLLSPLFFWGCAYPTPFENGLYGPEAPWYPERKLTLIFEREKTFDPVAGAKVTIEVEPPAKLLSPASGVGATDGDGALTLIVAPVAQYDQSVLKQGDIAVDFPFNLKVTMERGGQTLAWELSDNQSFARYRDPLYQGLNRDPDAAPGFLTLVAP